MRRVQLAAARCELQTLACVFALCTDMIAGRAGPMRSRAVLLRRWCLPQAPAEVFAHTEVLFKRALCCAGLLGCFQSAGAYPHAMLAKGPGVFSSGGPTPARPTHTNTPCAAAPPNNTCEGAHTLHPTSRRRVNTKTTTSHAASPSAGTLILPVIPIASTLPSPSLHGVGSPSPLLEHRFSQFVDPHVPSSSLGPLPCRFRDFDRLSQHTASPSSGAAVDHSLASVGVGSRAFGSRFAHLDSQQRISPPAKRCRPHATSGATL